MMEIKRKEMFVTVGFWIRVPIRYF